MSSAEDGTKSQSTKTRAFRIDNSVLVDLNIEAKERNVTVNAIVNEVLSKYVGWERINKKSHPITITSSMMKGITEAIPEEKIIDLAKEITEDILIQDSFSMFREKVGAADMSDILIQFCRYSGNFEYSLEQDDTKKTIILNHEVGKNWSIYNAVVWKIFLSRAGIRVDTRINDNSVIFDIGSS